MRTDRPDARPAIQSAQFVPCPGGGALGELVVGMTDGGVHRYRVGSAELFRLLREAAELLPEGPTQTNEAVWPRLSTG